MLLVVARTKQESLMWYYSIANEALTLSAAVKF